MTEATDIFGLFMTALFTMSQSVKNGFLQNLAEQLAIWQVDK